MPESFENCIAQGGKVRTISLPKGKYMHICYPKGGGLPVHGEVKVDHLQKKSDVYTDIKAEMKNMPMVSDMLDMMDRIDLRIFNAKHYGQTNGQYIKTNTKRGDVVNTIIHELMHCKYPQASEKEIQQVSAFVEGNLSMKNQAKLLENYEAGVKRLSDRKLMYSNMPSKSMIKKMGFKK